MLGIAMHQGGARHPFFMHVRWSTRLTWVVAASGFVWLLILFGLTMMDYLSRGHGTGYVALTRHAIPNSTTPNAQVRPNAQRPKLPK
jgi:hypothetical protein